MVDRLLFVCAKNVCRSAYLEAAVGARVKAMGSPVAVSSRGITVTEARSMCHVAAKHLGDGLAKRARDHTSQQLTADDLERADLVLTATTAERAAAALLHPAGRSRVFTVREALLLARVTDVEAAGEASPLRSLAQRLQSGRGLMVLPQPRPSRWRSRRNARAETPLDIPDRHLEGGAAHRQLFTELDGSVEAILPLLVGTEARVAR